MAKVKLTKNALKAERDALKRFQRYLPTLLLKRTHRMVKVPVGEGSAPGRR